MSKHFPAVLRFRVCGKRGRENEAARDSRRYSMPICQSEDLFCAIDLIDLNFCLALSEISRATLVRA